MGHRKGRADVSLSVENLVVRRGAFLVRVSEFSIAAGELVCLVGKSGCGKSTFLSALAGFLPVESGKIGFGGRALEKQPPERRQTAFVFQRAALFPHLNLVDNVAFSLRVRGEGRSIRRQKASQWLERVGLGTLGDRKPHQISEGQAQRVALARALITGFPLLLLDEPFSALDEHTRGELRTLLCALVKDSKVAALMVTHHSDDARHMGDRCFVMNAGEIRPDTDSPP